jgi:hypothetical protein
MRQIMLLPNSKINRGERTRINQLIHSLLNGRGKYIGVTATPARLDLNNTFDNSTEYWVDFSPHSKYIGQEFFFPSRDNIEYRLHMFEPDHGNEKTELRNAIFHFLCGVAEQHQQNNNFENFTMIVHTSGKIIEHHEDFAVVSKHNRSAHKSPTPEISRLYKSNAENCRRIHRQNS